MHTYPDYVQHSRKIGLINHATGILDSYDGLLSVPENGNTIRGEQVAVLNTISHTLLTDFGYREMMQYLLDTKKLTGIEEQNVRLSQRKATSASMIDSDFVKLLSRARSESVDAYYKAREKNDFASFAPYLEKVVALTRQYTTFRPGFATLYDAMLDDYDRGLTTEYLDAYFSEIKSKLLPIVRELQGSSNTGETIQIDKKHLDSPEVVEFFRERLREIGFDLTRGTISSAPASFMLDGNPDDVRICYRNTGLIMDMIASIFHEGGHGLYEQSFAVSDIGLPKGEAASYSMHESQSRLYENHVGYSEEYLRYLLPRLKALFPVEFESITVEKLLEMLNCVTKAPRRLDADEISYHIHILIRYEIERDLVNGKIEVQDLPRIWNAKYKEYLDIDVKNDTEGVLQDIHWSDGSFGYFPTYSLGTIYATQLFHAIKRATPDIGTKLENGELLDIKEWLKENVHAHGSLKTSTEIMQQSTGKTIDVDGYVRYVREKFSKVYNREI